MDASLTKLADVRLQLLEAVKTLDFAVEQLNGCLSEKSNVANEAKAQFSPEIQQVYSTLKIAIERLKEKTTVNNVKVAHVEERLGGLYQKLSQSQSLSLTLLSELSAFCREISNGNYSASKLHHIKLVKNDWKGNEDWLLALKSLLDMLKTANIVY